MDKPPSYCEYVADFDDLNLHKKYHDTQYGFEINTDNELFGRLILEINQAGLSWETILKKQNNFRSAFANFDIQTIANFSANDISKLLQNSGIIRNKLKINAVIHNARKVIELQSEHGSFKAWLTENYGLSLDEWVKLFRAQFKFTGGEITKEFLVSTGFLPGAHIPSCPIANRLKNI